MGKDSTLNNNFTFAHPGEDISTNQTRCPFSAHIRKSNPRADLAAVNNHIIRSGIPYGPEGDAFFNKTSLQLNAHVLLNTVTDAETASGTSDPTVERGLAFGQSNLTRTLPPQGVDVRIYSCIPIRYQPRIRLPATEVDRQPKVGIRFKESSFRSVLILSKGSPLVKHPSQGLTQSWAPTLDNRGW